MLTGAHTSSQVQNYHYKRRIVLCLFLEECAAITHVYQSNNLNFNRHNLVALILGA